MPSKIITFVKGDKSGSETDYRDYLPINMTGVVRPMFDAQGYMIEYYGLTQFGDGFGVDRGGVWNERLENHFRLSGTDFIEVDQNGVSNSLGTILGADTASLPYSFETQGIVADGKFYLYDPVNGFRQGNDPDIRVPIDGVWIDGYYCLTDGDVLYHTEIVAGTPIEDSIAPLALATAEFSPDPTVGVGKTTDNKWIAFNRYSIEFFTNVGGETFAFQRLPTRALKSGLVATHAKTEVNGTWFFVGGAKNESIGVHVMGAGSTQRISTREVEKVLKKYTESELSEVVLEGYELDGYTHLILHLPNEVLLFNFTLSQAAGIEQSWSILKSGLESEDWIGKHLIFEPRVGLWVLGDKSSGRLGFLDENSAEQYGEIQEWYLYTPYIYSESASIDELEIETIAGFTPNKDATVFISTTYDGISHSQEHSIEYGLPTEYKKRFIVYRLGYVNDWFAFRLRGASRSRMIFSRAFINYG